MEEINDNNENKELLVYEEKINLNKKFYNLLNLTKYPVLYLTTSNNYIIINNESIDYLIAVNNFIEIYIYLIIIIY